MLVRCLDEPTHLWLYPEHLEVIACDCIAVDTPRRVTPAQSRLTISIKACQLAEGGISLLDVPERGIGCRQRLPTSPRTDAELIEILRVAHIQRVKQDRIHYSEDDDVCPNAQHQSRSEERRG